MKKEVLIAYYTRTGNTRKIARCIANNISCTLVELTPINPYPANYRACVEQGRAEIKSGYLPPIAYPPVDVSKYDVVLFGSPCWCSTMAPPVATFIHDNPISGKQVGVFCTHGGGGTGHIAKDLAELYSNCEFIGELGVYEDGGYYLKSKVYDWLTQLNLIE